MFLLETVTVYKAMNDKAINTEILNLTVSTIILLVKSPSQIGFNLRPGSVHVPSDWIFVCTVNDN